VSPAERLGGRDHQQTQRGKGKIGKRETWDPSQQQRARKLSEPSLVERKRGEVKKTRWFGGKGGGGDAGSHFSENRWMENCLG